MGKLDLTAARRSEHVHTVHVNGPEGNFKKSSSAVRFENQLLKNEHELIDGLISSDQTKTWRREAASASHQDDIF